LPGQQNKEFSFVADRDAAVDVSVASGVGCAGCVGVIVTSFSGNGVADLLIGAVGDALTCAHAVRSANEKHSKYRILIIR
jgi:hypothetical protein